LPVPVTLSPILRDTTPSKPPDISSSTTPTNLSIDDPKSVQRISWVIDLTKTDDTCNPLNCPCADAIDDDRRDACHFSVCAAGVGAVVGFSLTLVVGVVLPTVPAILQANRRVGARANLGSGSL
jgi:hypothetical protein